MPVAIVLAVRLVVLVVVGNEVVERETVVGGDEVDARPRFSPTKIELVRRGAKTRRQRFRVPVAPPEVSHVIAKPVVPFRPAGGKAADLISARAAVPRLGDEFDISEHRILAHDLQEAAFGVEPVGLARKDRPQIEAESVDPRFGHPIAQTVRDHLDDARVAEVERVAGAGIVDVETRLVRHQPIVGLIVDPFERQRRAALVALRRVIVDDVEDHLEPAVVKPRDHLLEFAQRVGHVGSVARVRREKADRVVAPIVFEALLEQVIVVDEGVNRHELNGRDAQRFDVVHDGFRAQSGVKASELLVDLRVQLGEALDVRLVDDRAFPRNGSAPIFAMPIEIRIDDDGLRHEGRAVAFVEGQVVALRADCVSEHRGIPRQFSRVGSRVRVKQQLVGIEAVASLGLIGAVHAKAVKRRRPDVRHVAVEHFVGPLRKFEASDLAAALGVEKANLDPRRIG